MRASKTRVLSGLLTLILVIVLVGPVMAADVKMPRVMNVIGHGVGSKLYGLAAGFAKVGSKHLPTEMKVVPTSGPTEWVPMARDGEVDLAVCIASEGSEAYYGVGFFADQPSSNQRVILQGGVQRVAPLTRADSGIKSLAEVKGKRFVLFSSGKGFTDQSKSFLANAGLTVEDVKVVTVPGPKDGIKALIEGRADVTGTAEVTMGAIAELEAGRGARYLGMDPSPEAVARLRKIYPVGEMVQVKPGPGVRAVSEPIWMWAFGWYLTANTNLSEEVVYEIVKAYWEHDSELWPVHPGLKTAKKDGFAVANISFPYHDGAVKFYKEKGVWTPEMEKKQQELVAKEKK
jgi:TRAP transporter TAXI family solute receptor